MAESTTKDLAVRPSESLAPPLYPSRIFAGRRLLVVGGTGFLGKVWLSMLLHRFPEIGHVFLVVRAKGEQSSDERFWAEIAASKVFDPIREQHPGAKFEAYMRDKVTPVNGDVSQTHLGFSDDFVASLGQDIDALINVAGVVDFNPPLDEALDVNAFGVNNLIEFARHLDAPMMHTSTTYVAGYRTGPIEEVDPTAVPFPRAEGAGSSRVLGRPDGVPLDRELDRAHWDPQNEIDECMDVIKHTRHRCEDQFRQSLFLDEAKNNLQRRGEPCRGRVLDKELANVKRKFIKNRLVEAGLERARYWGWANIYTYTKSIGEQVLATSGIPYTIVRPAVVESSTTYPFQSWNEGINTSAPFIYMAMKGQVQFPVSDHVHLDIIPVDMVTSGMIAALAELLEGTHKAVYQFGAGDVNPCSTGRFFELIGLYKRKKLQDGGDEGNRLMNALIARFEPAHLEKDEYDQHGAHAIAKAGRTMASLLAGVGLGSLASSVRKAAEQEAKVGEIMDLFIPFTAECDYIFSAANTRHAMGRMPAEERARFYWEPEKIDWRQWMYEVHLPGIEKYASPLLEERLRRELKPLQRYENLLDLLDEMAERHDHAVALRNLEDDGFSRITFLEWREHAASCAARLCERGVRKGDRVILASSNRPAWAIAYFGILRAGGVAVPIDPKLTAAQMDNIVRSSGAKIAIVGEDVEIAGVDMVNVVEVAGDDRSLEPPPMKVDGNDVASIIYTSGTTGDPKGVMLTHDNFTSMLAAITPLFFLKPTDGVLSVLPLHHTFEFSCGLLLPMSRGACINYIGEVTSDRLSDGLDQGHITAMVGVPALWQMLERKMLKQIKEQGPLAERAFDFALELNRMLGKSTGMNAGKLFFGKVHDKLGGRVKYLISGGSALPKGTADLFAGLGLGLSEGYGLTEAAPVLSVALATPRSKTGHVGKPIPGVELKIDNPDKAGIGEVLARGPNVMQGYYGNDEATEHVIDADGWLHTGDLGVLDKRGQLVLSGRSKDVIVSTSGENIYPDDVEEMLGSVKHIDELAIVGVERTDHEIIACIAVPETSDDERSIVHARAMRTLREAINALPRHCRPAVVQLYDAELPKTATRKVKRSEARKIIERLMSASSAPQVDGVKAEGTLAMVQHAVAAIANRNAAEIAPNLNLASDLGFESLMAMELQVALEAQTGRAIDSEQLARVDTVDDLVRLVGQRPVRSTALIERAEEDALELPPPLAAVAKRLLSGAQMGFYDKVMKCRVYGRAFIPHNRNAIVISNHTSHLDMGFVKYALGSYGTDIVGLAAADYFFAGRMKKTYFQQLTNLQAFDRKTNLRQALREAADTLRAGKTMLMFPEGTRSKDGQISEFKATLGHIALNTRTDILPVYLSGTHESWPKGGRFPTRRDIRAHIGPPLRFADLERLTDGMKLRTACLSVAKIAREAVVAMQRGGVLDLSEFGSMDEALGERTEHPLITLFRDLENNYVAGRVDRPITFYFSLGAEAEAKWTARLAPDRIEIELGKPAGNAADCVLKTSADLFTKMIRESYMPTPMEVMSGLVKSNDVGLLATFQGAFEL
jgi:long-chain acyl-CoA synthetase